MGTNHSRRRRADQLPAGRHGLSRQTVVEHQRRRLVRATCNVVSLAGYEALSVENVTTTAGVSRQAFYVHFSNREEAFLAAYDESVQQLREAMAEAFGGDGDLVVRSVAALRVLLDRLAADPAMADLCVVDAFTAGRKATARRRQAMSDLRDRIAGMAPDVLDGRPLTPVTVETVLGGLHEIFYTRTLHGELPELRRDLPDLVYAVLLPHTGPDGAAAARTAAQCDLAPPRPME